MYRYIYLYVSKKSFCHLSTRNHQVSIHYKKVSEETLYNLLDGFISCTPPEFGTCRTPLSHYTQHPLHFISTIHNKSTITTSLSEHIQFSYCTVHGTAPGVVLSSLGKAADHSKLKQAEELFNCVCQQNICIFYSFTTHAHTHTLM